MKKTGKSTPKKGSFLQSISFQNIVVYGLILIVFIIYSIISNNAMSSVVSSATSASNNQSALQAQEALLREATIYLDSDINTKVGMVNLEMPVAESDFANFDAYLASVPEYLDFMDGSILVSQTADGGEKAAALRQYTEAYMEDCKQVRTKILAGDGEGALAVLMSSYYENQQNMNAQFDSVEESINSLSEGLGNYLQGKQAEAARNGYIMLVIVIVVILIGFLLSIFRINKTITSIANELQGIIDNINKGKGDLTARIQTKTKTELALISDGINQFIGTLQNVIKDVKDGATILTTSSDDVIVRIQSASDSVTNTSAAMEELSASMENVATTASDLNEHLSEVKNATEAIDNEAKAGTEKANAIKVEANAIKEEANHKKENTGAKMEELSKILEASVKDSEQVNQIGDLTNEILNIASQTNLLALNASIEAARAGEAGKGFAVVADEISALAANSRDTAGNIQEISVRVTSAVKSLSENAMQVIEFINSNVLADYDAFVDTGAKYENTATMIEEMLKTFMDKANNLNDVMGEMSDRLKVFQVPLMKAQMRLPCRQPRLRKSLVRFRELLMRWIRTVT